MSEEQFPQEHQQFEPSANPQQNIPASPAGFPPPHGGQGGYNMQQPLPNATLVLVFGILSIAACCCFYGLISLILSIVTLVLSKKDRALYAANPQAYTLSSYKNLNAGRVCAIIGLSLSALLVLTFIVVGFVVGWATLTDQHAMTELLESLKNR